MLPAVCPLFTFLRLNEELGSLLHCRPLELHSKFRFTLSRFAAFLCTVLPVMLVALLEGEAQLSRGNEPPC